MRVDQAKRLHELVGMFNDSCSRETEQGYSIDLEQVRKSAGKKTTEQTAYLVDIAKAEALDALGEREAGIRLAERYL